MLPMPRPRKPYTLKEKTRHGKVVWYFRRGKEERVRLPGVYGSREFNAAYVQALHGNPEERKVSRVGRQSLRWIVDQYYQSGRFNQFAPNTQRNRRLMLEEVCRTGSELDFRDITSTDIRQGLVRREHTPTMAKTYLVTMRALFEFAKDQDLILENPVPWDLHARKSKSEGYHTWTLEEVARYEQADPMEHRPAWLSICCSTPNTAAVTLSSSAASISATASYR